MLSVGRILEGAFGLVRERVVAVAIWAGVYLLLHIAMLLTMQPLFQAMADGATGVPVGADSSFGDRAGALNLLAPIYGLNLVMALIGIVLYAAAMRAVLRPQADAFGFLRVGADELRLLILLLIFGVGSVALLIAWAVIVGLVTAGVAAGTDSVGPAVVLAFFGFLAVALVWIFLIVRFSLAFPLTLYRRSLAVGEAWRLSRGRFWTLFGAALLITLIGGVMTMAVGIFSSARYFADLAGASGDSEAIAAAAQAQMARAATLTPTTIAQAVGAALAAAIWVALSGGSIATAAKLLLADEMDDAEEVFG